MRTLFRKLEENDKEIQPLFGYKFYNTKTIFWKDRVDTEGMVYFLFTFNPTQNLKFNFSFYYKKPL